MITRIKSAAWWVGTVAVVAIILSSPVGQLLGRLSSSLWDRVTTVSTSGPIVVQRLQALNRLETARQTLLQPVQAESNIGALPGFLGRDKLEMLANTEVVAGVDLSKLTESDVAVTGHTVRLRLPQPSVFSVRVEDESSRVYSRQRGWFVWTPDPDLERQARLGAQSSARSAARGSGLLDAARTNAETNIRGFLVSLGFSQVNIEWAGA